MVLCAIWPAPARAQFASFDRINPAEMDGRRQVSIVYADQNLRAPASMFGHTFLVFHDRTPPEPDAPVLEFVGDSAAPLAEVRAVFLSIPGRFQLSRFVFMRREYDLEDRGLVVYPLLLDQAGRSRLIARSREALSASWRYNFIGDNCSYQLLALVLRSTENAPSYLDLPFVLPSDTIAFLRRKGWLGEPVPLPSSLRQLEDGYGRLSPAQRDHFWLLASGARGAAADPQVAQALDAYVAYRAPREPNAARRNALFATASGLATAVGSRFSSQPSFQDPASLKPTLLGLGWRSFDGGVATATVVPAVRSFERATDDAFRNSTLEIGRASIFYRPGRFGLSNLRILYLDAEQPGSAFASGFTRYLDASFEKMPNRDWALHDEYRVHFGAGATVGAGFLAASAVVFTGPRLTAFEGEHTPLWDVGLKASLDGWLGGAVHVRSELHWTPLAAPDRRGLWSNRAACTFGRWSLSGGVQSPAGNILAFRGVGDVDFAF